MPQPSRRVALTARLERIKQLADDLARVHGAHSMAGWAMADRIKRDVNAVRRALKGWQP
jgi:hypothetical protein